MGWRTERFADAVESARSQLRPIWSLVSLTDSYARESRHGRLLPARLATAADDSQESLSALEVAYAMRFLELREGREVRAWHVLWVGPDA